MIVEFRSVYLKKRFPLTISRRTSHGGNNLFVSVTRDDVTGWGELSPGGSEGAGTAEIAQSALESFISREGQTERPIHDMWAQAMGQGVPACAMAGLDTALWDWLAKTAGLPLYRLLGLGKPVVPTSITIGIAPPETVRERVPQLLHETGIRVLKIKLGAPAGIEADQAMFMQVVESARRHQVALRVDANGGWNTKEALYMMKWLAERGAEYVEQPLPEGQEDELAILFRNRALPVFIDESCRFSHDVPKWAHMVDGVNLKLMKCGGITEALRIIATARAFGLKTMIGCMGESSMSISASAAISALIDHVDLDAHLNLDPDPCTGARLIDGIVTPNDLPGHGASLCEPPGTPC